MRALAALLSLVAPGSGHFLIGERVRGAIFGALGVIALIALPFAFGVMVWVALVVRVLAIGDVCVGVRTIRPAHPLGAALTGGATPASLIGVFVFVVTFYRIPSSSMEPTLHIGQHAIVNRYAYWLGSPVRGDLVAFRNPCTPTKVFLKRVVALAGDTVEVRCNVLYVNGVAAPSTMVADNDECSYRDLDDEGRPTIMRCSRYRETDGATYETLHGYDRPFLDRQRSDTGSYWDEGNQDPHDFPELDDPESARLIRPILPSCGIDDPRHRDEATLLGRIEEGAKPAHACDPQVHYVVPAGDVFVLGDNRQNSSDSRIWGPVPEAAIEGELVFLWGG